jgi:hypothetical protein
MKKNLLLSLLFSLLVLGLSAQVADTSYWQKGGLFTANFNNTSIGNYWQAGGQSNFTGTALLNIFAKYEKDRINLENTLDMALGFLRPSVEEGEIPRKQGDVRPNIFKAEDRIDLNAKLGYKLKEKLKLSSLLNFRTQFLRGLQFRDALDGDSLFTERDTLSNFFAPAYVNLGIGLDYQPSKDFSLYYAPLNAKTTIVTVDRLIPVFMGSDHNGSPVRFELGSFLKVQYRKKIMENITLQTKADFFTNYLNNFGNIDINWENLINMQVNKYIAVSFFTHLIYDDDIRFELIDGDGQTGPRTQFKHVLSVGLTYGFGDK